MFNAVFAVDKCQLANLAEKDDWDNGQKIGKKHVVQVLLLGEKPIVCDVPKSLIPDVSRNLGVWGTARVAEACSMEKRSYTAFDGSTKFSDYKYSKGFTFLDFLPEPLPQAFDPKQQGQGK